MTDLDKKKKQILTVNLSLTGKIQECLYKVKDLNWENGIDILIAALDDL